jgi:regulator of sigma E protease
MVVFFALAIFIIILSVHELGHFVAAKLCGISVVSFSIGVGKAIYKKRIGQTIYIIRLLPIGGTVRTVNFHSTNKASNQDSDASRDRKGASRKLFPVEQEERELFDLACAKYKGGDPSKQALLSAIVALAGPMGSMLFGMAFMFGVLFVTGTATNSKQLIVEEIIPGTPAAMAGLAVGDIITSVDRKSEEIKSVVSLERLNAARDKTTLNIAIDGKVRGTTGWSGKHVTFEAGFVAHYPWTYLSFANSANFTINVSTSIIRVLVGIFSEIPNIMTTPSKQGGFVALTNGAAPQISGGIFTFLALVLNLSFIIAITSLIPFPGFDGWHAILHLAEAITKRPAPMFIQQSMARVGLAAMSLLTVYLIGKDVFDYVLVKLF